MRAPFGESEHISSAETWRLFREALGFVRPHRARFVAKAGLLLVGFLPPLLLPWPTKVVIDHVIEAIPVADRLPHYPFFVRPFVAGLADATPLEMVLAVAVLQLVLLVVVGAFGSTFRERDYADAGTAQGYDTATQSENDANSGFTFAGGLLGLFDFRFTMRLSQDLNHRYRSHLFRRIQSLPMKTFDDERIGDAVYRVMVDTPAITNVCYRLLLTPTIGPLGMLLTIGVLVVSFGNQPVIWGAGLALIPITALATLPFSTAYRNRGEASRRAGAETTGTIEEGVSQVLAVQSLGASDRARDRFDRDSEHSFGAFRSMIRTGLAAGVVALVPIVGLAIGVFLHVVDEVIAGRLTPGDFALLFTYFTQLAFLSFELGGLWFLAQTSASGLHRVGFVADLPSEIDPPAAPALPPVREGIRMEDVHFAYHHETPVLRGVDLDARVGEVVALVGPAGAGKTTLASLVPRFLEPDRGRVLLDGVDIAGVRRDSLRSQVAFVFQETMLFEATIAENIRVGAPDASDSRVEEAARMAGAHEFIERLPEGYATPLGRSGSRLSVGQKQRLAIARALVRDAPVLILDEPTSALDPATERQLVVSLRDASRSRLVLVVAHRLSTIRAADQILFMDEGRVRERGRHEELMAIDGGAYRRFVALQTTGEAPEDDVAADEAPE